MASSSNECRIAGNVLPSDSNYRRFGGGVWLTGGNKQVIGRSTCISDRRICWMGRGSGKIHPGTCGMSAGEYEIGAGI